MVSGPLTVIALAAYAASLIVASRRKSAVRRASAA
jgi:hypothetical protein